MALRQQGNDWYGDGPEDVWEYFVQLSRDSPEPVKHWRQAVCRCGHTVFEVDRDEEANYLVRRCSRCNAEVVMFADEYADAPPVLEPGEEADDPIPRWWSASAWRPSSRSWG